MSVLRALDPHALAAACAALDWPWDAIGSLLMDPDGHALLCEPAHEIAFEHVGASVPAKACQRASARALLGEFGLPLEPAELPGGPGQRLIDTERAGAGGHRLTDAQRLSLFLGHARELFRAGCRVGALVETLVGPFADDPSFPLDCAETAAVIASRRPVLIRPR